MIGRRSKTRRRSLSYGVAGEDLVRKDILAKYRTES